MTELLNSATWTSGLDAANFEQGAAKMVASSQKASTALTNLEVTTEKAGKNATLTAQAWTRFLASIDPATRAQVQYNTELSRLDAFQKAGLVSTSDLAIAQGALASKFQDNTEHASKFGGAVSLAKDALGALGATLSIGALVGFGKEVFETAAGLDSMARTAGVSVAALQAYRAELAQNDISTEATDTLLRHFTRSMGDATAVAGSAREAYAALGLTQDELAKGAENALPAVARGLLGIHDASERARIEVALFGKSGQEMEAALNALATPTQNIIDKQTALYHVMGDDVAKAAHDSAGAMTSAWQSVEVAVAPIVVHLTNLFADLIGTMAKGQADFSFAGIGKGIVGGGASLFGFGSGNSSPAPKPTGKAQGIVTEMNPAALPFGASEWSSYLNNRKEEGRLIGLAADEQSREREAITQSIEKQTLSGVAADKINRTYAFATKELTAQELSMARANVHLSVHAAHVDHIAATHVKITETFSDYLTKLQESARLAGLTAAEREDELNITKAASIIAGHTVETYAQALTYISAAAEAQIRLADAEGRTNTEAQRRTAELAKQTVEVQKQSQLITDMESTTQGFIDSLLHGNLRAGTFFRGLFDDVTKEISTNLTDSLFGALGFGGKHDGSSEQKALYVQVVGGGVGGVAASIFGGSGNAGGVTGGFDILGGIFKKFLGLFDDGGSIGPGQWGIKSGMPEIIMGGTHGVSVMPISNDNRRSGGNVYQFSIDARGAQHGVGAEIRAQLEPMIRTIARQEDTNNAPTLISASVQAMKNNNKVRGRR